MTDVVVENINSDNTVNMGITVSVTKTGTIDRLTDPKITTLLPSGMVANLDS